MPCRKAGIFQIPITWPYPPTLFPRHWTLRAALETQLKLARAQGYLCPISHSTNNKYPSFLIRGTRKCPEQRGKAGGGSIRTVLDRRALGGQPAGSCPRERWKALHLKTSSFKNLSAVISPLFECCLAEYRADEARSWWSQRPMFPVPLFCKFLATLSPRVGRFPCKFLEMLLCLIIEFEKPFSSCRDCFVLAWLLTLYRLDRTCISEDIFIFNHLYFIK